jgi:hypothetical protein
MPTTEQYAGHLALQDSLCHIKSYNFTEQAYFGPLTTCSVMKVLNMTKTSFVLSQRR